MQKLLILAITIVILINCNPFAHSDTIILKDGRKIEGFIVEEQKNSYLVKIPIGSIKVKKENVSEIKRLPPEENYLNFGNQYLLTQNYDAALEQYKKALATNPDFQPAKDAIKKAEKLKREEEEKKRAELEKKEQELLEKKEKVTSGFGFSLEIAGGKFSVLETKLDSPAEIAGIKAWDIIVQIDGQLTKDKQLEEILDYLLKPEATSYQFTIQRDVDLVRKRIEHQKRSVVGVGIFLDAAEDGLIINSVITGGPADLAGLKAKDRIIAIDGKPTQGISFDQASGLISGAESTSVKFTIQRNIDLIRK
ncbi:MAG: PDZ domain-containing protein [Candidatus Omnitrophota bacterium]